ncbi:hypothetical protein [Streptomyces sp. NPDC059786]|uniref:hypothetical protein n=1 Tax=Streptomyces sp. NPDC059786 TaxID=3346946 RepID=UPI00365447D9
MRLRVTGATGPETISVTGGQPSKVIEVSTAIATGAVSSVNGETGAVVLDATDIGAVTDADPRLSDARTPTVHAASHGSGGTDAVTVAQSQVTGLAAALAGLYPSTGGTVNGAITATGGLKVNSTDVNVNGLVTDAPAGVTARLAVMRVGGSDKFSLDVNGALTLAAGLNAGAGSTSFTPNLRLGSSTAGLGGASGGALAIANITTAPTSSPSGGAVLYIEGGVLKVRESGGSTAVVSAASISGALQATSNLSDVSNRVTSLGNLGVLGKSCTVNETNSTTSQQASTQLVVPVAANAVYAMAGKLAVQTPSGINFVHSFTGPSGATMIWGDSSSFLSTIGATDSWSGTGATKWANIFGTLTVGSTAGNLTVTFASGTAANTATLAAGSHITLQRIA